MPVSKIAVIILTYNQERFLADSLKSVFSQTRKPDEVIIVDNGSADNSDKIITGFKRGLVDGLDRRIKYIKFKTNLGPAAALNKGITTSGSDYLIILPADDWFAPQILEEEVKVLDEAPDVIAVYAQTYTVIDGKKELRVAEPSGKVSVRCRNEFARLLLSGDFMPLLTVMFRRSVIRRLGKFDNNLRFHGDYEFWIRLARHWPFAYIAKPLAYYRVHGANDHLSLGFGKSFEGEFAYILKKHLPKKDRKLKKLRGDAYRHYYLALFAQKVLRGEFGEALKFWWLSVKLKPLSFGILFLPFPFGWYLKKKFFSPKKV